MMLVTGASGLLGTEILNLCPDAVGLSSKERDLRVDGIKDYVTNETKAVIHCAAKVGGIKANTNFPADFYDENARINLNVLDAIRQTNTKLVSLLSTCVYPDAKYVKYPLTEDQIHMGPPPISNEGYAYSKRMLEFQGRMYRKQFNCNVISVIPNNLYGPHDNYDLENCHVIPAMIRRIYEAKANHSSFVTFWGSGAPRREFTFARDAAKIVLWLTNNYDGETPVNIGNSEQITIMELAQTIARLMNFKGEVLFDKTKPDGQFEKPSCNEFLKSLGWNEPYTPLEVGLRETIDLFEKQYPNIRGCK